ncbi:MAG: cytidine deaminase [Planctomycetota bacterium]|jgi:cytidine deaminase
MTAEELLAMAQKVRQNAHSPYSKYQVGAALLAKDGRVFVGCNVENSSYGLTICAERTAAVSAVAAGAKEFLALAVVTENGGSLCGACRQFMAEFGTEIEVYLGEPDGTFRTTSIGDLLPDHFGPGNLGQ